VHCTFVQKSAAEIIQEWNLAPFDYEYSAEDYQVIIASILLVAPQYVVCDGISAHVPSCVLMSSNVNCVADVVELQTFQQAHQNEDTEQLSSLVVVQDLRDDRRPMARILNFARFRQKRLCRRSGPRRKWPFVETPSSPGSYRVCRSPAKF